MQTIIKKISISLLGVTLILSLQMPLAPLALGADAIPETETSDVVNEPISQVQCFSGGQDFASFIQAMTSFEDFNVAFQDLVMNACQYNDVKILKDKLADLRDDIRLAYMQCDKEQARSLRLDQNRVEAELFFVRNLASTKKKERIAANLSNLKERMFKRFVKKKGYFTEKQSETTGDSEDKKKEWFEEVWQELTEDYDAQRYVECKGETEMIREYIDNLRNTIAGISEEFKEDAQDLAKRKEQIEAQKEKKSPPTGNKTSSKAALKESIKNTMALSMNGVRPQQFAEDLAQDMYMSAPNAFELRSILAQEQMRYNMDLRRARSLARYRAKYQQTDDAITQDYVERIDLLISTIDAATITLNDVNTCVDFVNAQQCVDS